MFKNISEKTKRIIEFSLIFIVSIISVIMTYLVYKNGTILAYGDAAAHMNIAKRAIDGLTPGFGQLGSVWLPLQHILIMPFLWNDFMWRSGLAGSIVSMIAYILCNIFIYKTLKVLNFSIIFATIGTLVFAVNPNILYMQSTAMGELPLLCMYTGSTYYFIKWMQNRGRVEQLVISAFFGFLGTLIRYDAWFLIGIQTLIIISTAFYRNGNFKDAEGKSIIHGFLAYLGVIFWLLWNFFIFGNPFNFFSGQYTAREQQMGWLKEGKLITYMNPLASAQHYGQATLLNGSIIVTILAIIGMFVLIIRAIKNRQYNSLSALILFTPFLFYVFTLIIGNSILFIPGVTPESVGRTMFNIRYGLMMLPFLSVATAFLFRASKYFSIIFIALILCNYIYLFKTSSIITYEEGTKGIASRYVAGINPTEKWFNENYQDGYVMLNTYYGAVDITNLKVPMKYILYEGSYGYWQESLKDPGKYAKWIILKENDKDPIWHSIKESESFHDDFNLVFNNEETRVYLSKN